MADIEPEDIMDDAEDRLDEQEKEVEKDENLEKKEVEKIKEDVKDMKDSVSKYEKIKTLFEKAAEPGPVKDVMKFVISSSATAVIFFFVTLTLKKATGNETGRSTGGGSGKKEEDKHKADILDAVTEVSKDVRNISRLLSVWLTDHQDEKIKAGEYTIPLVDIFSQYTTNMKTIMDSVFTKMQTLADNDNRKTVFSIPSIILVNDVLTDFGNFIDILPELLAYAEGKAKEYPTVKTFPLLQSDIDTAKSDYDKARKLPY